MAVKDVFKVSRKTFVNPRAWVGYDNIKDNTRTIKTMVTDAMTVRKPERTETFEEALERMDINEKDLPSIQTTYLSYAIFFVFLAVLDLGYGIYLLFYHHAFLGLILSLAVCALLLAQAFRNHFWYFQIKERKLGCTFEEWRDNLLGKRKN